VTFKEEMMSVLCSRLAILTLIAGPAVVAGCQRSAETTIAPPATEQSAVQGSAEPTPSTNNGPAAAWQDVVTQIVDGKPELLADALPARYRDDLDQMLVAGLASLDPEVRREVSNVVAELAQTLSEKEEFVLGSSRFNFGGSAAPFVRAHFAELCRVVVTVAKWPGWTAVEAPKSSSLVEAIAEATIAEPSLIESLKSAQFENGAGQKDDAQRQVLVSTPTMKEPRAVEVVRVEDRWLPRALVDHWLELFGAQRAEELAADSSRGDRLRQFASRLREITASLEAVTTQAEFDALVERASTQLMASAAEANATPRRVESDEFVTVVVRGRLTDEEKDRLVWELASKSDEPASSLADAADGPDGEAFEIHVGPVEDVASFAKRLQGLVVEEVDASAKIITARATAP